DTDKRSSLASLSTSSEPSSRESQESSSQSTLRSSLSLSLHSSPLSSLSSSSSSPQTPLPLPLALCTPSVAQIPAIRISPSPCSPSSLLSFSLDMLEDLEEDDFFVHKGTPMELQDDRHVPRNIVERRVRVPDLECKGVPENSGLQYNLEYTGEEEDEDEEDMDTMAMAMDGPIKELAVHLNSAGFDRLSFDPDALVAEGDEE
ncbi:hypothetical protein M422DRAFT_268681, partial [Sphaerobolus stellatus SS14]